MKNKSLTTEEQVPLDTYNPFGGMKLRASDQVLGTPRYYPETVWHYTNTFGLIKIIQDRTVRFTDTLFLNDATEGKYGAELFRERLVLATANWSTREKAFARRVYKLATAFSARERLAVFCMSAEGELLNQFRDYGKGVQAFSIGLDPFKLVSTNNLQSNTGQVLFPALIEVVYDRSIQEKMSDLLIEMVFEILSPAGNLKNSPLRRTMFELAAAEFGYSFSQFKHPAFAAEKEIRLVLPLNNLRNSGIPELFDVSSMGPRAYYLPKFADGIELITDLVVGPGEHTDVAMAGVKQLLAARNLSNVQLRLMDAPLRS